jgi:hypothetical protein
MTEAASISETSVNFYQTTRRNNPEDSHLHIRRRENLKSHALLVGKTDSLEEHAASIFRLISTLIIKSVCSSETSIYNQKTTRHNNLGPLT